MLPDAPPVEVQAFDGYTLAWAFAAVCLALLGVWVWVLIDRHTRDVKKF